MSRVMHPIQSLSCGTGQKVQQVRGAKLSPISDGVYDLLVDPGKQSRARGRPIRPHQIVVDFAGK